MRASKGRIEKPFNVEVQEEGVLINRRRTLNFIGDSVTAADDVTNKRVDVTIDTAVAVAAVAAAGLVLADAKYIQLTAPSGDNIATGWAKTITAGTALVFGDVCYIGSDGKMEKANATVIATMPVVCMALGTIAENATGLALFWGFALDTALTLTITGGMGNLIYVSAATAGLISSTIPTGSADVVQVLGFAVTVNEFFFNPNLEVVELVA